MSGERINLAELRALEEFAVISFVGAREGDGYQHFVLVMRDDLLALVEAVTAAHDPARWDEFLAMCESRFDFGGDA